MNTLGMGSSVTVHVPTPENASAYSGEDNSTISDGDAEPCLEMPAGPAGVGDENAK